MKTIFNDFMDEDNDNNEGHDDGTNTPMHIKYSNMLEISEKV